MHVIVVQPLKHNIFFILELFLLTEVFEAKIDQIFFLNAEKYLSRTFDLIWFPKTSELHRAV